MRLTRCYASRRRWPGSGAEGLSSDLAGRNRGAKERDTGERGQPVHQLVLESRVTGFCCGRVPLPVIPVAAADGCGCVVADGEPGLRQGSQLQVTGCFGAAHLGRDPARIDGVAEYVRPGTGQGERERGYLQLALGVGLCGVPLPLGRLKEDAGIVDDSSIRPMSFT